MFRHFSRTSIHSWAAWDLVQVEVQDPDGGTFIRTYVDSPGAVGVVPVSDDGTVYLVRQYRTAIDGDLLEIPAGMRDVPGEDPLLTGRRELMEEAGLSATSWVHLGHVISAAGISNATVELYLARGLGHSDIDRHGPEEQHMTIEELSLDEAVQMVVNGDITDSKTMVGLLLAHRHLRDNG